MGTQTIPAVKEIKQRRRARGAYLALELLTALYFFRPEDVIPGLNYIPLAKITGGIAAIALVLSLAGKKGKTKFPLEVKLLLLFFAWYCISIPFAYWRSGALVTVTSRLSKGIMVAIMVSLICEELWQLKRLVWIQAAAVAGQTALSLAIHHTQGGRLSGALGGVFENPNDLAINIALNWPLCVAFFFMPGRGIKKLFWGIGLLMMLIGVQMTYSRSGFLALAVAGILALWEFAVRGRRMYLVVVAALLGVAMLVASPSHYFDRLASIVTGQQDNSLDRNSRAARKELLIRSLDTAFRNPFLGVGAGNFEVTNGSWRVAHNTYTEIAAEGGFPALILFLMVVYRSMGNLTRVRRTEAYRLDPEIQVLTGGLWVALMAFLVGALFASTEYSMYPYYLFSYTTALYLIASRKPKPKGEGAGGGPAPAASPHRGSGQAAPQLAWMR